MNAGYTQRQGQFLAFVYSCTKIHRCPPAERDMQRYFRISAPAIHRMAVTLNDRGFIERELGKARSIRLRLSRDQLPNLE